MAEIDVLHAKLQAFIDPHPGAVQQLGKQPVLAFEQAQNAGHLVGQQDHRQSSLRAGYADFGHPGQVGTEHLAVEEEQRRQRLLVRRGRHAPGVGQPGEERLELAAAHGCRVAQAMESDKSAHPVDISLFRSYAVVQIANALAQLIEHLDGFQGWQRWVAAFHNFLVLYKTSVYKPPAQ
jgi:hypothetical protein